MEMEGIIMMKRENDRGRVIINGNVESLAGMPKIQ